jgi:1-acyl-sn-glycerol-3-phosphate acyltransferase
MFYFLSKAALLFVLKTGFGLRAYGRENIPAKGALILASNHRSLLDPPALGCACRRRVTFMAREDLFRGYFLSRWMRAVGVIALARRSADFSALKEALRRLKQGKALGLFPEGTRSNKGDFGEPLSGIGFLAAKSAAAIVPAYIKGTDDVLPKGAKRLRRARISVYFGPAFSADKGSSYEGIAQEIMRRIKQLAQNSDKESGVA